MNKIALIVAGGSGLRMGTAIPKQFLLLKGKPVLMHTIERFNSAKIFDSIIIVLPKSEIQQWEKLILEHSFKVPHKIVVGGNSRSESVKSGLNEIREIEGHIAIHDGVRPLVSTSLIKRCMQALKDQTNAIPAVPVVDSIRKFENGSSEVVDRNLLRAIQTPQCFHLGLLNSAYQGVNSESTDDATVFERAGNDIHLIEGEKSNIKITVSIDLLIAEALIDAEIS
ncbi:MAG: 2-C-methyl-D-erythritol 4-phosphate cytidylyltransferase [Bacteroidia bacterium]|nr:2-C-methyl-D-erythritol 4-phosphate cytidylyltransferase [Bacteroidia bacterium]MBP6532412.1 2-C-methyl-D-erythritol 4-phosphate cytidylyltransferase [Bacteroidia bacterium]